MSKKSPFSKNYVPVNRNKLVGDIIIKSRTSFKVAAYISAFIAICICTFVLVSPYHKIQKVQGKIFPSAGIVDIRSETSGIITDLYVNVGDAILAGEPLILVKQDTILSNGTSANQLSTELIEEEITAIVDQLKFTEEISQHRQNSIKQQKNILLEKIKSAKNQISITKESVFVEEELFARYKRLTEDQTVSFLELQNQKSKLLNIKIMYERETANLLNLQEKMQDLENEKEAVVIEAEKSSAELQERLSILKQKAVSSSLQQDFRISAPVNGRVSVLYAHIGQRLPIDNAPLVSILPADTKLHARLMVPSNAIGMIEKGQKVKISYDAFPHQKFGYQNGRISEISHSAFTGSSALNKSSADISFLVIVDLDSTSIVYNNKRFQIQPDMKVDAQIVIDSRPVWLWITDFFKR